MAKTTSLLRARVTVAKALDREIEALESMSSRSSKAEIAIHEEELEDLRMMRARIIKGISGDERKRNASDAQIVARGISDGGCDWSWRSVKDIDDELCEGTEAWGSTHIEVGQLMRLVHRLLSAELDHVAKINTGEVAWEVTFRASRGVKR